MGDSDGVANGQIIDPIGGGNPTLSINDVSISEGNSGITNAQLTVSLSAPSSQTISVSFATSDGTAISGSDYITTIGTITFAPSETIKTVIVPVNGDLNIESDETFFVDLSNPTDILITDSHGIVTIINDDSNIMPITFCGKTIDQFAAVIDGTVNNDVLKGTLGDDLIQGFTGNDRIFGMSGNNCIIGGLGNDYLVGGAGDDTIQENDDNDKIWGQAGIDTLFGGTGIDRIVGGTGNDFLYGESENDFLWGQTGDDILDGGTEIDICLGGLDSNTLTNCE